METMGDLFYDLRGISGQITLYNQDIKIIKGSFEIIKLNDFISEGITVIKVFNYSLIGHRLTDKESQMLTINSEDHILPILDYELETKVKLDKFSEEQDCIIKGKCKADESFNITFSNDDFIILLPIIDINNSNIIWEITI